MIRRYSGYVAAYLGDGMLVYFGYPRADEHDPQRAVRTGLEVVADDRWRQALDGHGQVVLLSGEAGIDKSRLTQALRDHVGQVSVRNVSCHCSPYHANSALFPVVDLLQRRAGIQRDLPARDAEILVREEREGSRSIRDFDPVASSR